MADTLNFNINEAATAVSEDSYKPLVVSLEIQVPVLAKSSVQDAGNIAVQSAQNQALVESTVAIRSDPSAAIRTLGPVEESYIRSVAETSATNDFINKKNSLSDKYGKRIVQDQETGDVYLSKVLDVAAHLVDIEINESASSLVWHGHVTLFDPSFTDLISADDGLNGGDPLSGSRLLVTFDDHSNLSRKTPTYMGRIVTSNLTLQQEGAQIECGLVALDVGISTLAEAATRGRPYVDENWSWSEAIHFIGAHAGWDILEDPDIAAKSDSTDAVTGFSNQPRSGSVGVQHSMPSGSNYLEFAQSIMADACDAKGNRLYLRVIGKGGLVGDFADITDVGGALPTPVTPVSGGLSAAEDATRRHNSLTQVLYATPGGKGNATVSESLRKNAEQAASYAPIKTKDRITVFFGTESFARDKCRFRVNARPSFTYGGPQSNTITAQVDSRMLLSAMLGSVNSRVSAYNNQDSVTKTYAVRWGSFLDSATTTTEANLNASVDALIKNAVVIEISNSHSASDGSNKASVYLDRLRKAQMTISLTVPGTHAVRVFDLFDFQYITNINGVGTSSFVSGQYSAQSVVHRVQGGQWVTAIDGYRYSSANDDIGFVETKQRELEKAVLSSPGVETLKASSIEDLRAAVLRKVRSITVRAAKDDQTQREVDRSFSIGTDQISTGLSN